MTQTAHSETVAAAAQADTKKVLDVLVIGTGFAGVCWPKPGGAISRSRSLSEWTGPPEVPACLQ